MDIVNHRANRKRDGAGAKKVRKIFQNQLQERNRSHREQVEEVDHHSTCMAGVENPVKCLGKSIRDREDAWNMPHNNVFGIAGPEWQSAGCQCDKTVQ